MADVFALSTYLLFKILAAFSLGPSYKEYRKCSFSLVVYDWITTLLLACAG